jgi:glucose-1-phosphate thymidylyltransferase
VTPRKAVLLAREPNRDGGEFVPGLVSVANRPLLAHALDWLQEGGVEEVAILASDRIAERMWEAVGDEPGRGIRPSWLYQVPRESLGDSLTGLRAFVDDEPFVLHMADSLGEEHLPQVLGDGQIDDMGAVFLTHGSEPALAPVVDIRSGLPAGGAHPAGVAVLGGGVLETTTAVEATPGSELSALASHLNGIGGSVEYRAARAWWRFGESRETMLDGNRFALERLEAAPIEAELRNSRVQGAVLIHPSAQLDSSTVRGPAVIGPGARLVHAYVGPFTSIGANVLIEGAEVENSVILPGASIAYLDTRLEGSVIGAGSRVFRDFRLPRAMRLNIGGGAEVAVT